MTYETLESQVTHKGKIVTITVDKIQMPDGSEAYRETVVRGKNAAAVLPVFDDGRILFVRQYRHAFGEMLLEIPAGVMEDGEAAEMTVLRELEEETGWRAARTTFLCEMYPTVGFCTEKIAIYFAFDLAEGTQKLDADEFVEVEVYTLDEALQMVADGRIKDGKTIAALFAYKSSHK